MMRPLEHFYCVDNFDGKQFSGYEIPIDGDLRKAGDKFLEEKLGIPLASKGIDVVKHTRSYDGKTYYEYMMEGESLFSVSELLNIFKKFSRYLMVSQELYRKFFFNNEEHKRWVA